MSCECYKIGGPFISEDPDCPAHGWAAKDRERKVKSLVSSLEATLNSLELSEPTVDLIIAKIREIVSVATEY